MKKNVLKHNVQFSEEGDHFYFVFKDFRDMKPCFSKEAGYDRSLEFKKDNLISEDQFFDTIHYIMSSKDLPWSMTVEEKKEEEERKEKTISLSFGSLFLKINHLCRKN